MNFSSNDVQQSLIRPLLSCGKSGTAAQLAHCHTREFKNLTNRCQRAQCVLCASDRTYLRQQRILKRLPALLEQNPGATLLSFTGTTVDCQLPEIRERFKDIRRAWGRLFKPCGNVTPFLGRRTIGSHAEFYATPTVDDNGEIVWNIHVHALLIMKPNFPYSGLDYVRVGNQTWEKLWLAESGRALYRSVDVEPVRNLTAAVKYMCKASHNTLRGEYQNPITDCILDPDLIIGRAEQLRGLKRYTTTGQLVV